jgi:hypothetical protein
MMKKKKVNKTLIEKLVFIKARTRTHHPFIWTLLTEPTFWGLIGTILIIGISLQFLHK